MAKEVNVQRDQNRAARVAAKREAVKVFSATYSKVVSDLQVSSPDMSDEDVAFEAVTQSVVAYQDAYKQHRGGPGTVSSNVEEAAA